MIQFKKIPPSKSVLILLLFLTTNIHGFLQENSGQYRDSRKTQNRFSMDKQQTNIQNVPLKKFSIDRLFNEKDRNAERLYDRRSFRTGTIRRERDECMQNRERTTENQRDLNNNQHRFARNLPEKVQYNRDNKRSFESAISRENLSGEYIRARQERTVQRSQETTNMERRLNNRQIDEQFASERFSKLNMSPVSTMRSLESRRVIRSVDLASSGRNAEENRLSRDRLTERETRLEERSLENRRSSENQRELTSEIRAVKRQTVFGERQTRNNLDRRMVENRDRIISENRVVVRRQSSFEQRRSFTEPLVRVKPENSLEKRSLKNRVVQRQLVEGDRFIRENREGRISEGRNVNQRRLSRDNRISEERRSLAEPLGQLNLRQGPSERRNFDNQNTRISHENRSMQGRQQSAQHSETSEGQIVGNIYRSAERLDRFESRQNPIERHTTEHRNRRISKEHGQISQRRFTAEDRTMVQRRPAGNLENADKRISNNRDVSEKRLIHEKRSMEQKRSLERQERLNSRKTLSSGRSLENREREISGVRDISQRRLLSEGRIMGQRQSPTEHLEKSNSRETSSERVFDENQEHRIFDNKSTQRLTARIDETRLLERRLAEDRNRRISKNRGMTLDRTIQQRRLSLERLEKRNSRENASERRTTENGDPRTSNIRDITEELLASTRDQIERSTERFARLNAIREHSFGRQKTDSVAENRITRDLTERRFLGNRLSKILSERRDSRSIENTRKYRMDATQEITRRLSEDRRSIINSAERRLERVSEKRDSRSDSTRYLQNEITKRSSRLNTSDQSRNYLGEIARNDNTRVFDRYNTITAVSQRATNDFERNSEMPTLKLDENINTNTAVWVDTAKVLLAAFLIGQIFVNSSKSGKSRFLNIMSIVAPTKQKTQ